MTIEHLGEKAMQEITVACLDMAGTTVADDGSVMAAFAAASAVEADSLSSAQGRFRSSQRRHWPSALEYEYTVLIFFMDSWCGPPKGRSSRNGFIRHASLK